MVDFCVCLCVGSTSSKHDNFWVSQFQEAEWPDTLGEHRRAAASRAEQGRVVQQKDESSLITKASNCPPQPCTPTSVLNSNYGENTVHCHPILSCWRAGRANRWTLWLPRGGGEERNRGNEEKCDAPDVQWEQAAPKALLAHENTAGRASEWLQSNNPEQPPHRCPVNTHAQPSMWVYSTM